METQYPGSATKVDVVANDLSSAGATLATDNEILGLRSYLLGRARFLTQDPVAAEDLVQDTIERGLVARVTFEAGTNMKAWLCTILRNLFIDARRRDVAQRRVNRELLQGPREAHPPEEPERGDIISLADILGCLDLLSSADREIFAMFYFQHLSYREIAAKVGKRSSTIGTRLLRLKRKLRAILMRLIEARCTARPSSSVHVDA
jgi:RNA polymerase sigma-70 factor (ECF subfamily)